MFNLLRRLFGAGQPTDAPPRGTVAAVTVRVGAASGRGVLLARDGADAVLLKARVVTATGPASRVGGFAQGDYGIDAVQPAPEEAGSTPLLRLRAITSEAAPPPGCLVVLIHGAARSPADGSIGMDDADLARLLACLPEDGSQVQVRVVRIEDDDWDDDPAYGWSSSRDDVGRSGDEDDQTVSSALSGLGYTVLTDEGELVAKGEADAADAAITDTQPADDGWTPASGAYGP